LKRNRGDAALSPDLKTDIERIGSAGIPLDVVFEQGQPF
jgi:hypothetical protein